MLDVGILACLYTLRLQIGAELADVILSAWLAGFSLAFFLSLSLAKRHTEIVKAAARGLASLPGRGYRTSDGALTLAFGVASAMSALLLMILFLFFVANGQPNYHHPKLLLGAPLLTFLWLSRVWLLASRGELDDDPLVFALRDRASILIGGAMLALAIGAVTPA